MRIGPLTAPSRPNSSQQEPSLRFQAELGRGAEIRNRRPQSPKMKGSCSNKQGFLLVSPSKGRPSVFRPSFSAQPRFAIAFQAELGRAAEIRNRRPQSPKMKGRCRNKQGFLLVSPSKGRPSVFRPSFAAQPRFEIRNRRPHSRKMADVCFAVGRLAARVSM